MRNILHVLGSTSAIDDYAMSVSSGDESMEPKKEEEAMP